MRDEKGQVLVEFTLCFLLFMGFFSALMVFCWWNLSALYLREAAFETARCYAVYVDEQRAKDVAREIIDKGGWLFVKPETLEIHVNRGGDRSVARVAAQPRLRVPKLAANFWGLVGWEKGNAKIVKEASCTLEYRFRKPWEFEGV
ncbi:MAG: TadE/TadG family type IV pilus assembly protein [Desulfotomaculales bacterium]